VQIAVDDTCRELADLGNIGAEPSQRARLDSYCGKATSETRTAAAAKLEAANTTGLNRVSSRLPPRCETSLAVCTEVSPPLWLPEPLNK
jgi:hypothetical protein